MDLDTARVDSSVGVEAVPDHEQSQSDSALEGVPQTESQDQKQPQSVDTHHLHAARTRAISTPTRYIPNHFTSTTPSRIPIPRSGSSFSTYQTRPISTVSLNATDEAEVDIFRDRERNWNSPRPRWHSQSGKKSASGGLTPDKEKHPRTPPSGEFDQREREWNRPRARSSGQGQHSPTSVVGGGNNKYPREQISPSPTHSRRSSITRTQLQQGKLTPSLSERRAVFTAADSPSDNKDRIKGSNTQRPAKILIMRPELVTDVPIWEPPQLPNLDSLVSEVPFPSDMSRPQSVLGSEQLQVAPEVDHLPQTPPRSNSPSIHHSGPPSPLSDEFVNGTLEPPNERTSEPNSPISGILDTLESLSEEELHIGLDQTVDDTHDKLPRTPPVISSDISEHFDSPTTSASQPGNGDSLYISFQGHGVTALPEFSHDGLGASSDLIFPNGNTDNAPQELSAGEDDVEDKDEKNKDEQAPEFVDADCRPRIFGDNTEIEIPRVGSPARETTSILSENGSPTRGILAFSILDEMDDADTKDLATNGVLAGGELQNGGMMMDKEERGPKVEILKLRRLFRDLQCDIDSELDRPESILQGTERGVEDNLIDLARCSRTSKIERMKLAKKLVSVEIRDEDVNRTTKILHSLAKPATLFRHFQDAQSSTKRLLWALLVFQIVTLTLMYTYAQYLAQRFYITANYDSYYPPLYTGIGSGHFNFDGGVMNRLPSWSVFTTPDRVGFWKVLDIIGERLLGVIPGRSGWGVGGGEVTGKSWPPS